MKTATNDSNYWRKIWCFPGLEVHIPRDKTLPVKYKTTNMIGLIGISRKDGAKLLRAVRQNLKALQSAKA